MDRDGENFLESVCEILKNGGVFGPKRDQTPVVKFEHPKKLKTIINFSLGDSNKGLDDDELRVICDEIIAYSVKTGSRHFHNQLYGAVDNYGLAGSWITEALNTSQYTYEVAPALTLIEESILKKALKLLGFPEDGDGILSPGGSIANMYGMVLARYNSFPNIKTDGMSALPRIIAFTSEDSHYSLIKGSHWLGIGTNNLIKVKTDSNGRMIPSELRSELQKATSGGAVPFFINATAGTTVLGSIDPLIEISDICREFNVWMHVDACLGGTLLLSSKHCHILKGIERADSVSWNPHKMLGAPLQCSLFLTRHKGVMHNANSATATYLFQQDKFYDVSYDTGDKSIQCGRKVDAFKLWLMWKARGDSGLEKFVDNVMNNIYYFKTMIKDRPGFELVTDNDESTNVCFWYVPTSMRSLKRDDAWWNKMHMVSPKIKERMILQGSLMIGYTPLNHKKKKNFFRFVVTCHPPSTKDDVMHAINEIEKCGEEILF